jgi:hypothetical protein
VIGFDQRKAVFLKCDLNTAESTVAALYEWVRAVEPEDQEWQRGPRFTRLGTAHDGSTVSASSRGAASARFLVIRFASSTVADRGSVVYLRLIRFTLSETGRSKARDMADDLTSVIKEQLGCISVVFFGGGDDGEGGLCVLWASQDHADAAAAVISPRLEGHLAGNVIGQPERRLFPVLAS